MNQVVRQKQMCELIAQRGECSIEQLMERFGVSGMTVRRDLQSLADQGKVIRTHGGAAMAERISFEFEFLNRVRENHAAKEAIAAAAAAQIKDGESVMLDSGTTTLELAKRLRGRPGLTVITSSLPIAAQLQYDQQIEVLLLGGRLRASSPDLAGALTESNLETLRADVAFLGADAVDCHEKVSLAFEAGPVDSLEQQQPQAAEGRGLLRGHDGALDAGQYHELSRTATSCRRPEAAARGEAPHRPTRAAGE